MTGHSEFGFNQMCINTGNSQAVQKIRKLWNNERTMVKGWAYYWSYLYDYIMNLLETRKDIQEASLIIRHEDLCENPAEIIDKILEHTELPLENYEKIKKYYVKHLHKPTYYTPNFTKQELEDISDITKATSSRFGY
jgi:hypothetical protein